MLLYRIAPEKFALDLSGEGARLAGGRWNPKLMPALYTSEHPSLAFTETLPSFSLTLIPDEICLVTIEVPDSISIKEIDIASLPVDWNVYPHPTSTQAIGKQWLEEAAYAALKVPSTMGPLHKCWNIILNPVHKELQGVMKADKEPWDLDPRIGSIFSK